MILTFFVSVPHPVSVPCTLIPLPPLPMSNCPCLLVSVPPIYPVPRSSSLPILVVIPHCYNKVSYRIDLRKKGLFCPHGRKGLVASRKQLITLQLQAGSRERRKQLLRAPFLLFIQSTTPTCEMMLPTVKESSSLINLGGQPLIGAHQGLVS